MVVQLRLLGMLAQALRQDLPSPRGVAVLAALQQRAALSHRT